MDSEGFRCSWQLRALLELCSRTARCRNSVEYINVGGKNINVEESGNPAFMRRPTLRVAVSVT